MRWPTNAQQTFETPRGSERLSGKTSPASLSRTSSRSANAQPSSLSSPAVARAPAKPSRGLNTPPAYHPNADAAIPTPDPPRQQPRPRV